MGPRNRILAFCLKARPVLSKQFLGKGYIGWFAIAFPAVVRAGIWNLAMMPAMAQRLFSKDTVGSLTSINEREQTGHPA